MLRTLLRYEPETGKLFWLERDASLFRDLKFSADRNCRIWNTRYAGAEAFKADDGKGYLVGSIFGRAYNAHRVIWALIHGEWPKAEIDHINGDRSDNRISNLRSVSVQENARNSKLPADNTSGAIGVSWKKRDARWQAYIAVNRRHIHLGYFDDFDAAVAARKEAELRLGFHPNHGRSSPVVGNCHA
jgi:hypothetical protein